MANDPGYVSELDGHEVPLTTTERAVLAVLARGASLSEAAETFGWSEREASAELMSASRKLGARSGLEALLLAVRRGAIRRPVLG